MEDRSVLVLLDARELDELIHRQMIAMDMRDWAAYRSCLAETIEFDMTTLIDAFAGRGVGTVGTDPDEWLERAKASTMGFDATLHRVTNLVHAVEGDEARSWCFVVGDHILNNDLGDPYLTTGTVSTYGSVRTQSGWRLQSLKLELAFCSGNSSLFAQAGQKYRVMTGLG